jgi:two-component system, cell cycle sensor histidine kinase and response regulator CckA
MDAAQIPELGGGSTVLVVDDDPRILTVVAIILAARGYRVLKSAGPADAIKIFEEKSAEIDILLLDVTMPGMTGPELNVRLQELKPNLPALFMTGYAEAASIPINVLEKPFRMDDLLERIAETLRNGAGQHSTGTGRSN